MPDCDHCGESFDDQEKYARHLRDNHDGELSRIEQQTVEKLKEEEGEGISWGSVAVVLLFVVGIGGIFYVVFFSGGGGGNGDVKQPTGLGTRHYHGPMTMTVMGEKVDFSRSKYQLQSRAVHFEGGDGTRWHVHAQDVTLGYFMQTLGIEVSRNSVTYQGTTYTDGENANVTVQVDGNSIDPSSYVLQEEDRILIRVEQLNSSDGSGNTTQ
ncbi:MAG: hypothetical protein SV760_04270 [Halobacteria archaeon]|nr:hypothetical protein [Halobacteria archaeon]